MTYRYRTYRCEWVAQTGSVDQYGMEFDKDWEEACPTREEAEEKLRTKAHYDEKLLRWVTGKAYHEGRVFYREVLVKEEDLS